MFPITLQGNCQAANLRKQGCLDHDKLHQLFALRTATGSLQIFANTPALNSDEKRALKEELSNASAPTFLDDDYCTPNFESIHRLWRILRLKSQSKGRENVQCRMEVARIRRYPRKRIG